MSAVARCSYCDDTGDVHGIDGEWRGRCTCAIGLSCEECGGTGQISIKTFPGGIEVDNDDQPCPSCTTKPNAARCWKGAGNCHCVLPQGHTGKCDAFALTTTPESN